MGVIAKYKFDRSVYADLIPEFNAEFTNYTIADEVDSENSNHIIRTIESDSLPTLMRFGQTWEEGETRASNRSRALLEILDMDTSELKTGDAMFRYCINLTSIVCNWNTSNITQTPDMFSICHSLVNIDVSNWETSKFTNIYKIFQDCNALRTIDMRSWNTSNITNFSLAFYSVDYITTLDISNWIISDNANITTIIGDNTSVKYVKCNISNTISKISTQLPTRTSDDPGVIIYQGAETLPQDTITTLNSKGWSVATNPTLIAEYKYDSTIYKNFIPQFNDGYMGFITDTNVDENGIVTRKIEHVELPTRIQFGTTHEGVGGEGKFSLLEIIKLDTSNLTSMYCIFRDCAYVTSINTDGWNTSKITDMTSIFNGCGRLTSLDVSNLDTSSAIYFKKMFIGCTALTSIDASIWKTNKIIDTLDMFRDCTQLKLLDISNYDLTNVTLSSEMFAGTTKLTDIGMIYCNKETVNKVASLLPTDVHRTIWVGEDDITQYDQYDHITYKTQKVQDTVHLNSPLLKGDTIEVIDGKTYHVHRYEKVVLDGNEEWAIDGQSSQLIRFRTDIKNVSYSVQTGYNVDNSRSDRFVNYNMYDININEERFYPYQNVLFVFIKTNKLQTLDTNGFKQWLSENPTTIIYELVTPYYELISETPLNLTLPDTENNIVNNNSLLPSNMTITNKELSTIAIKPSTIYTLAFDKSIPTSNITIDICSSEQVTTSENMITLTTPSELGSGIRFLSTDGCVISNVRLLEGSLVESAIPKESFEGLKNSFDDGYLIGDNLLPKNTKYISTETPIAIRLNKPILANTPITVIIHTKQACKSCIRACLQFHGDNGTADGVSYVGVVDNPQFALNTGYYITTITPNHYVSYINVWFHTVDGVVEYDNITLLEGDHTHLSEKELLQLIEKGTSHYTEEDWNNLGKYKVEYKVTGKNKFDINNFTDNYGGITFTMKDNVLNVKGTNTGNCYKYFYPNIDWEKGKTYTLSVSTDVSSNTPFAIVINTESNNYFMECYIKPNETSSVTKTINETIKSFRIIPTTSTNPGNISNVDFNVYIQIEEGLTATPYDIYKEQIKTFYLNSPLLEGDTIEDVNGVATHVKRMGKIVLDGSENWNSFTINPYGYTNVNKVQLNFSHSFVYQGKCNNTPWYSNYPLRNLAYHTNSNIHFYFEPALASFFIDKSITSLDDWKLRLKERPMELVCQLASPQYEKISDESILCDSYVNGHLDFNSAVPIEKIRFREPLMNLKYLQPNTNYTIQFESDNVGKIDSYFHMGSRYNNINVVKGTNRFDMTTLPTIEQPILYFDGIGFNASNIQVIANATHENGDVKEFDYFKGLKSTFEDKLITDENDEHYGQYAVDVKVVGKNKIPDNLTWEIGNFVDNNSGFRKCVEFIPVQRGQQLYYSNINSNKIYGCEICFYDYNKNIISRNYADVNNLRTTVPKNAKYMRFSINTSQISLEEFLSGSQLEEGTQATPYEPYKESSYTIYLNSPLLKDDTIEVVDGKLSHVHRYGMVTLDGSSDETIYKNADWSINNTVAYFFNLPNKLKTLVNHQLISDKFATREIKKDTDDEGIGSEWNTYACYMRINKSKLSTQDVNGLKQWLQANPTTIVYELATPTVENIEPIQSGFVLSSIKEGDMTIDTALPIKVDLEYRTNMAGTSALEEQLANVQNGANLIDIINSEVDE